jgi:hypothetical protein
MRTVVLLLVIGVITAGFAADLSGKWVGSIAWNRTRSVSFDVIQPGALLWVDLGMSHED